MAAGGRHRVHLPEPGYGRGDLAISGRPKAQLAAALLAALLPLAAEAIEPQPFDYWMLALSWSPQYCAGKTGSDPQCGGQRYGFIVHGLWPQRAQGFPKQCPQAARLPETVVRRMLPLMPSPKLVQHEWNRHGACTGWPVKDYFDAVEAAWRSIRIPHPYVGLAAPLSTRPQEVEAQFQLFNPGYDGTGIALQCSGRWLREVRLCMDRQYRARACAPEIRDRCGSQLVFRPEK